MVVTLSERLDAARQVITQQNESFKDGDPGYVNPDEAISCIKMIGGTSNDRLAGMRYEDILQCLPEMTVGTRTVKPVALAKDICGVFRDRSQDTERRPISNRQVDRMTPRELVENFDPEDHTNKLAKRLTEMSKGKAFVVYSDGRTLDIDNTHKLLLEVKKGFPARETITIDGKVKTVYKVGSMPDMLADENPIYPGRPLRPDGTCDQTNRSWDGIPNEVRQFVRVGRDHGIKVDGIERANDIIDFILREPTTAFTRLAERYSKACVKFNSLKDTGDLPSLRVSLNEKNAPHHTLGNGRKVS